MYWFIFINRLQYVHQGRNPMLLLLHIEPNSSVKNMAADQIKRACQNYWGGGMPPPGPSPCYDTDFVYE